MIFKIAAAHNTNASNPENPIIPKILILTVWRSVSSPRRRLRRVSATSSDMRPSSRSIPGADHNNVRGIRQNSFLQRCLGDRQNQDLPDSMIFKIAAAHNTNASNPENPIIPKILILTVSRSRQ